ncbi:MAG: hypothetical protein ACOZB0_10260 [Pseudomonadota bacterium]
MVRSAWLRRLPGFQRSPPGLEWWLLRRMPWILLVGTVLPLLGALAGRLWPHAGSALEIDRAVTLVDFIAFGTVVLHWTLVLTLTLGCVIVWLMKGPAYVADAYPLHEADRPDPDA